MKTDTKGIQRIVRKYYEHLNANKLDNLDEMDKFLETYNLSKLNQEESENLKRQIAISETEAIIIIIRIRIRIRIQIPTHKSGGPDGFTGEFYQTYQEKLTPLSFSNYFIKFKRREGFQTHFYKTSITLISKPDRDNTKKIIG